MATVYVSQTATNGYVVGSDANSGLSKALAKLTWSSAYTAASSGDTIVLNDGTYTVGASFTIGNKNLTINSEIDYGATFTSSGSVEVFDTSPSTAVTITFGKVIIDAQNVGTSCIICSASATKYTVNIAGTKFVNIQQWAIRGTATTNIALNVSGAIFSGSSLVNGCTIIGIAPSAGATTLVSGSSISITGSTFSGTVVGTFYGIRIWGTTGVTASITSNTFSGITSTTGGGIIDVRNIAATVIDSNTLSFSNSTAAQTFDGISLSAYATGPVDSSDCVISNNVVNHSGTGGHMIIVGTDGSVVATDNLCNRPRIYGNVCTGSSNSGTLHGIMLGSQQDGLVYGNISTFCSINYLSKLQTGTAIFSGNIAKDTYTGGTQSGQMFRCKGATGTVFVNNFGYFSNPTYSGWGFYIDADSTIPTNSTNIVVKNNIIYGDHSFKAFVVLAASSTATFANNNYYITGDAILNSSSWQYQGVNYATFATWQAANEATALNVDPLFITTPSTTSSTGDAFKLQPSSSLYHAGAYVSNLALDFLGRPFYVRPTVGAYEFTSRSLAQARTAATQRTAA